VPFTLAHGAAVLPFRRLHLVTSALLIGSFAPDFEYFLRLAPDRGFGHTLLGAFILSLPLALLVLWLFHGYVKLAAVGLLPKSVQVRLTNHLGEFRFGGVARFALVVASVLIGIATHLTWDSFTHRDTWVFRHWSLLGRLVDAPFLGSVPMYKILQHGSTVVGLVILPTWLAVWYRSTQPAAHAPKNSASIVPKIAIIAGVTTVALGGGTIRAVLQTGVARNYRPDKQFVGVLMVTAIALLWWQLVAYGVLLRTIRGKT
jgi:hypothetical protein